MSYPGSDSRAPSVLILTGILPVSEIERKKNENDILLVTEDNIKANYPGIRFHYIFTSPKTNRFLSLLSSKWASYYRVQKSKRFLLKGRTIHSLGIIMLPKKLFFRNILYAISFWLNRKLIESIIKETNPTAIHAQSVDGIAYFAKKISKKYDIPYIVTLRGLNLHADHLVIKNLIDAKHLVAISLTQKKIAERLVPNKINLIPHGIPEHFFSNEVNTVSLSPIKLVVVCRLMKLKNIDKVIKSLSNIKKEYIFHIYGEGIEKENLQLLIKDLKLEDKIQLKGFIKNNELPETLKKYNIFVMPSFPETLGRVYLEAMACGLPVIASKGTGLDGMITDGEEGYMVDHKIPHSLDDILTGVFEDPEKLTEMKSKAAKLAEQFRWESISRKIYKLYVNP